MTNFKGDYVTVDDVKIAKNYLSEIELQRLNLLVSQFLDYAEFQALEQQVMTMNDWIDDVATPALATPCSASFHQLYAGMPRRSIAGD